MCQGRGILRGPPPIQRRRGWSGGDGVGRKIVGGGNKEGSEQNVK